MGVASVPVGPVRPQGLEPARRRTVPWHTAGCLHPLPQAAHSRAFTAALGLLDGRDDLSTVLLCGSVLCGEAGPTSDLDLDCVVIRPSRQRRYLVECGVLVGIFLNPPGQIRRCMRAEPHQNRPSTAHMLTTGCVLLDRRPEILSALRTGAAEVLAAGGNRNLL